MVHLRKVLVLAMLLATTAPAFAQSRVLVFNTDASDPAPKAAFDQWLRAARPELVAAGVAVSTIYLPLVRTRMIAPTAAYDTAPTMTPEHAARLVASAIVTRRRAWKPWWLFAGEWASLLLRPVWERGAVAWVRRRG